MRQPIQGGSGMQGAGWSAIRKPAATGLRGCSIRCSRKANRKSRFGSWAWSICPREILGHAANSTGDAWQHTAWLGGTVCESFPRRRVSTRLQPCQTCGCGLACVPAPRGFAAPAEAVCRGSCRLSPGQRRSRRSGRIPAQRGFAAPTEAAAGVSTRLSPGQRRGWDSGRVLSKCRRSASAEAVHNRSRQLAPVDGQAAAAPHRGCVAESTPHRSISGTAHQPAAGACYGLAEDSGSCDTESIWPSGRFASKESDRRSTRKSGRVDECRGCMARYFTLARDYEPWRTRLSYCQSQAGRVDQRALQFNESSGQGTKQDLSELP